MDSTSRFNKQDLYDVSGLVAVVTGGSLLTLNLYEDLNIVY